MRTFSIFSDSSCDIDGTVLEEWNIGRIPFYVSFDQVRYQKEIDELSLEDFYRRLTTEKIFPKTSLPTIDDYARRFAAAIKDGHDILCICITSHFSGSYQAAVTARDITLEDYPEASICILNSMQATGAQGMTVLQAAKMRAEGWSLSRTYETLKKQVKTSNIMFTVGTLEYLQRGGRIGKVTSLAGSLLNLNPLIELYDGELMPYGTTRGRKKALKKIVDMTGDEFEKNGWSFEDYEFGVITGNSSLDDTLKTKERVEALIGRAIEFPPFKVGVTIGTYTGPDPVGITYIKKFDKI